MNADGKRCLEQDVNTAVAVSCAEEYHHHNEWNLKAIIQEILEVSSLLDGNIAETYRCLNNDFDQI